MQKFLLILGALILLTVFIATPAFSQTDNPSIFLNEENVTQQYSQVHDGNIDGDNWFDTVIAPNKITDNSFLYIYFGSKIDDSDEVEISQADLTLSLKHLSAERITNLSFIDDEDGDELDEVLIEMDDADLEIFYSKKFLASPIVVGHNNIRHTGVRVGVNVGASKNVDCSFTPDATQASNMGLIVLMMGLIMTLLGYRFNLK